MFLLRAGTMVVLVVFIYLLLCHCTEGKLWIIERTTLTYSIHQFIQILFYLEIYLKLNFCLQENKDMFFFKVWECFVRKEKLQSNP